MSSSPALSVMALEEGCYLQATVANLLIGIAWYVPSSLGVSRPTAGCGMHSCNLFV